MSGFFARSTAGSNGALLLLAMLTAAAAVSFPLLVYSVTLAAFGLPHVLSELRYVDRRFGRRLAPPRIAAMVALLAAVVTARACGVFGLADPMHAMTAELFLVVALLSGCRASIPARRPVCTATTRNK